MPKMADYAQLEISSRTDLRQWLLQHHQQIQSIWVVTFKKSDPRYVPYDAIVEEALCFGWVDSLPRRLDDKRSMLLLSPRKSKSAWSALNKKRAEKLIASGAMHASGLAVVQAAKSNGLWDKLNEVENLIIPEDLATALKMSKSAAKHFEAFPRSVKRGILEWILNAKRPETRAARISETVNKAKDNIRANQ